MFFNKKDPIIMGVDVVRGILRPGAPICVYDSTVFSYQQYLINIIIEIEIGSCRIDRDEQEEPS